MNSLLRMTGAVKKFLVEKKRSTVNLSPKETSLAVTLWVIILYILVSSTEVFFSNFYLVSMFVPSHLQSFSTDGTVELFFHKNSCFMGIAFKLDASVLRGRPLFPHVLCKSLSVRLLLDPATPQWYPGPPGFTPLAALPVGQRVRSTSAPTSRAQKEVRGSLVNYSSCFFFF